MTSPGRPGATVPLPESANGAFAAALDGVPRDGTYEVLVQAEGPTFQRQYRHPLHILPFPVTLRVQSPGLQHPEGLLALVKADPVRVRTDGLPATVAGQQLEVRVMGALAGGESMRQTLRAPLGSAAGQAAPLTTPRHSVPPPTPATTAASAAPPVGTAVTGGSASAGANWPQVALMVLLVNLLLAAAGLGGYVSWRRRRVPAAAESAGAHAQ